MRSKKSVIIEPIILRWARASLNLSLEEVEVHFRKKSKQKFDITQERLKELEREKSELPFTLLEEFAALYKRPMATFFLSEPPKEEPLPKDFRIFPTGTRTKLSSEIILVIRKARQIQSVANEILTALGRAYDFPFSKYSHRDDPATLAISLRNKIKFSRDLQRDLKSTKLLFNWLRTTLENAGVIILKISFPLEDARAFSLGDKLPFVVVINSKDGDWFGYAPKVFSLMHEFAHLLIREGAICNNFGINARKIERFCNEFAASFLVPTSYFKEEVSRFDGIQITKIDETLARLRKTFKVSREVLLLRLLALGYIDKHFYEEKIAQFTKEYQEQLRGRKKTFPRIKREDQILASYGATFVTLVLEAQSNEKITNEDAADYLDLKLSTLVKLQNAVKA